MDKDPRFALVKEMIEKGISVQKFRDIFLHIPTTVMAKQIDISYRMLRNAIDDPEDTQLNIFFRIAEALEVEPYKICLLAEFQLKKEKGGDWWIKHNLNQ